MLPIHVIALGAFGEAVAKRMAEEVGVHITYAKSDRIAPAEWPLARLHVLTAWRHAPSFADAVDAAAFAWRVPWLPVVAEHPFVYIGPAVLPGVGPCYTCFRRRLVQHSQTSDLAEALHAHYEAEPPAGPKGYLPAAATLAAMKACELIDRIDSAPAVEAGNVYQLHLLTCRTLSCGVVGIHGCRRCGTGRNERTRSYAELKSDLSRLLPMVNG
jgi:bacteriocin biosynthesis cyclodehydratase domain-containing protein